MNVTKETKISALHFATWLKWSTMARKHPNNTMAIPCAYCYYEYEQKNVECDKCQGLDVLMCRPRPCAAGLYGRWVHESTANIRKRRSLCWMIANRAFEAYLTALQEEYHERKR
jgi:hypothetical protein